VSYIAARVDQVRVLVWLILSLLLPAAGVVLFFVENRSSGGRLVRNPIVDTVLAPLLTDVREVLLDDANGISNMSYLTRSDEKSLGELVLATIDIKGAVVLGMTKK